MLDLSRNSSEAPLRGAVLLLGSLYWEGNEREQDGTKGEERKHWRDTYLDPATIQTLSHLPIRYGRRSASRCGQFTIVFAGEPVGVAKVGILSCEFSVAGNEITAPAITNLKSAVNALARAEGISTQKNPSHWTEWGVVAIAINPRSRFGVQVRQTWVAHFKPRHPFDHTKFGAGVLDADGVLEIALPWEQPGLEGADFCLSTPTKPDAVLPTAQQIAEAAKKSSYFERTACSGITTADDAEIRQHLRS